MKRFFRVRYLLVLIIALIVATGVLGFAASNTMPADTSAGDGNVDISGYTISSTTYTLNATDPTMIDSVNFNVAGGAGKPGTVKAALVTGGTFYTCTSATAGAGPWAFVCGTTSPPVSVLSADNLRVVAAQ
jgi:hypothetical protein